MPTSLRGYTLWECVCNYETSRAAGPLYWILLTGPGVSVSSMRRVALRPCGQVAPLGVLLLAIRVATTTVVRRPPGVALLRVAHPSSASVHQAPVTNRVATAIASNVAVHAEMIKPRPRPRPSPRGVHGWGGGGRWWMDVMKVGWRDKPPETYRGLPLQTTSSRLSIHLVSSDDDRLLRVFSEAFKAVVSG